MTREEAFDKIWTAAKIYYTQAHGKGETYLRDEELPPVFAMTKAAFAATSAPAPESVAAEPNELEDMETGEAETIDGFDDNAAQYAWDMLRKSKDKGKEEIDG
jgi:hypothetical protein